MAFVPGMPGMGPAMAQGAGAGHLNELLDDFTTLFDTEWLLLLTIAALMFSIVGITISSLMMFVSRHPVGWVCKAVLVVSVLVFVLTVIYLIEPRPSHWMATLGQIEHWVWTRTLREQWMRIRRWWRWRKKYAMKTKLNV